MNYLSTTEEDVDKLPGIGKKPDDSFKIIDTEEVTSGCTDYDAVNYREIPGWKIISTPQRQLFYDVNDDGEMIGINGVKSNEVNFYYKDIRVIKRKTPDAKTPDGYHRVVFKADRDGSFGKDAEGKPIKEVFYDVIDELEFRNIPVPQKQDAQGTLLPPVITPDPNCEFVGWQDRPLLDGNTVIRTDYTFTAKFKPLKDVIEITTGDEKLPDYFVDVYLDTTDKADATIPDNQFTGGSKKHFKVNPEKIVEILAADPQGGGVKDKEGNPLKDAKGKEAKWQFKSWQVKDDATKVWNKGEKIKGQFTEKETTIVAQYNLKWSDIEHVPKTDIGEMWVFESLKKDDGTWVNNFMPKKDQFDQALKKVTGLPEYQSYKIITSVEEIYDQVKEEGGSVGDSQPRIVQIQAEVTFKNGTKKVVNIPVKVFKNIYLALNDEDKPNVVKNNPELSKYVKVTVNPTDKAVDKQRRVYYVNPLAQVLIPEKDPQPTGNYKFEGWYYKDPAQVSKQNPQGRVKVDLANRMMISQEREIIATYSTPTQPILPLEPMAGKIIKSIGDSLTVDDYEAVITPPKDEDGKDLQKIRTIKIVKPKEERVTTENAGDFKETIEVFYEDGSSTRIDVHVKVVPDFVPQTGKDKPEVPGNFVKVTCDPTNKALDSTPQIYWVNPEKKVTLPEGNPVGKEVLKADGTKEYTWLFTKWDKSLTGIFKVGTTITAEYQRDYGGLTPLVPISDPPVVDLVPYGEDKITGNGIPGSKITVTDEDGNPLMGDDGNSIEVSVDENGKFTIPTNRLPEGKTPKDVYLTQTEKDKTGKEKMPSDPVRVVEQGPKYIVSKDPDHPGEVQEGYVRLIFDATEDCTVEGHQKKIIDVRSDVPYEDEDLQEVLPKTATYKNSTKVFDKWSPTVPKTGPVTAQTFEAQYKGKPVVPKPDPEPGTDPDKPNPDKPNPDKPNPDKPNPDKPNPGTNPDKPNPDKPNPGTNPEKPNPDTNPDAPNPEGKDIVVNTGETANPEDGIRNKDKLPKGTTYKFKNKVDTSKPGDKKAVIVVTYPDGSVKEVTVTVKVMAKRGATANKGATPKTGDTVLLGTVAMGAVAMGLYGVTLVAGKKKKTEDK